MQEIAIRLALSADAPDMADVHMRSWEAAYGGFISPAYIREKNAGRPALWQRILAEGNTTRYIIKAGGKTAGFICVGPSEDEDIPEDFYDLQGLYLHPEYFRRGIGTQAMDFAFNLARERGKTAMTVWVFAENTNGIKFYEKCGFTPDGKMNTYFAGRDAACIRMRRTL